MATADGLANWNEKLETASQPVFSAISGSTVLLLQFCSSNIQLFQALCCTVVGWCRYGSGGSGDDCGTRLAKRLPLPLQMRFISWLIMPRHKHAKAVIKATVN